MTTSPRKRPRTRTFLALSLLVALLVAGVASYYASTRPDGLNSVARQTGFSDRQEASRTADGPLAGYSTKGVSDARVSRGVAGVAGSVLVLGLSGGLFWMLRRRSGDISPADDDDHVASGA